MAIDNAPMNELYQLVRVSDTFREPAHDIAITLTLDVGHVIAQADIATLEYTVHLGNLTDNLRIEVKDSAVVLAKLLNNLWRNETSPNQFLPTCSKSQKNIIFEAVFINRVFNFKNVGI